MTAIDRIESALEANGCKPLRSGDHIDSRCPSHDDRHSSLSLDQRDGKVLVKCHAGCTFKDVVKALGLDISDFFDNENAEQTKKAPEIEVTYDYCDEFGTLLYQVVRYSHKNFKQRRPNGSGGWIWNLNNVRRVPYRLAELIAAVQSGELVLITEGEKDADRLASTDFAATCNSGGAGKFLVEFAQYFKGAKVVVLPDNDEAGRAHARSVAEFLQGAAKEIRVVELPSLNDHADVSDWLDTGGDATRLKALIEATAPLDVAINGATTREVLATSELLEKVRGVLKRFVVFRNEHQVVMLALWVLHTHVFDAFDTTPYIAISSPTKQAGKTRLFEVIQALVARPWSAIEATEAVLFRKIAKSAPTLLLDEIDAAFGKDSKLTEGIRAILNSGYRRGASVPRCVGPKNELKEFSVYCPKAFAGIGSKLPDTVRDRSIPVELRRRGPSEKKPDRLRRETIDRELFPVGVEIAAWGEANRDRFAELEVQFPEELSDRQQDAWEVLFAIAELAGGDWPELARRAAIALHGESSDQDVTVLLLAHLREIFSEKGVDTLSTKVILESLTSRGDDSPWASWWGADVDLDKTKGPGNRLARMLKPYEIEPTTFRSGLRTFKGYRRADFEDAWTRYLSSDQLFPAYLTPSNVTTEQCTSEAIFDRCLWDAETASDEGCYVVTFAGGMQHRCVACGELVAPAVSSSERGMEIICPTCSGADQ